MSGLASLSYPDCLLFLALAAPGAFRNPAVRSWSKLTDDGFTTLPDALLQRPGFIEGHTELASFIDRRLPLTFSKKYITLGRCNLLTWDASDAKATSFAYQWADYVWLGTDIGTALAMFGTESDEELVQRGSLESRIVNCIHTELTRFCDLSPHASMESAMELSFNKCKSVLLRDIAGFPHDIWPRKGSHPASNVTYEDLYFALKTLHDWAWTRDYMRIFDYPGDTNHQHAAGLNWTILQQFPPPVAPHFNPYKHRHRAVTMRRHMTTLIQERIAEVASRANIALLPDPWELAEEDRSALQEVLSAEMADKEYADESYTRALRNGLSNIDNEAVEQ